MKIGTIIVAAAVAFGTITTSHGATSGTVGSLSQNGSAVSLLPADHRIGPGATITRICVDRAKIGRAHV